MSRNNSLVLSLDTLPIEIQCSIFRLLDPIGLISISQTCRGFRDVTNPQRRHFVERLLALECLEGYGGVTPIFRSRDNALEPGWGDDDKWETMRWACTGCLRLLSHHHFDNHSILRLGYRKPIPGSPAALASSSWEPSGQTISRTALKRRKELKRAELKKLRWQYGIATTLNWGRPRQGQDLSDRLLTFQEAGMVEFVGIKLEEFENLNTFEETVLLDRAARSVERQCCGFKRRLRRCNECRFRQGDLRSHAVAGRHAEYQTGANLGTKTVPMVIGRRRCFGSLVDRYLPSVCEELVPSKPKCGGAPEFTIYRHGAHEQFFTMYMIRCPRCEHWLEMHAFRCGGVWPKWWPAHRHRWGTQSLNWDGTPVDEEFVNSMRCNSCYADEQGEDKLSEKLTEWFELLGGWEIRHLEYMLNYGWSSIWHSVDPGMQHRSHQIPLKYHFQVQSEVLAGLPWRDHDEKTKGLDYEKADLKSLNKKHKIWMQLWPKCREGPEEAHDVNLHYPDFVDWFDCWMGGYDRLEANWVWRRKCREIPRKKPGALLGWARRNEGRHAARRHASDHRAYYARADH